MGGGLRLFMMDSWVGVSVSLLVWMRAEAGIKGDLGGGLEVGRGEVNGGVVVVGSMGSLPWSAVTFGGMGWYRQAGSSVRAL